MNKNQKPSMSKRRATVAAVLCFVAAIAIAGTYTFNDYRKTQKNELAKAEEKAKQDSEAAKETGTSKIKNEDMTGNGRKKSQYQLYGRQLHPVAGEWSCDHELQHG